MALNKSLAPIESSATHYLHQRRIALLGLGVENRALARFFHTRQIPFSVCDARAPATPVEGVQQWRIGERYLDDLTDFDLLFRTPGLPTLDPRLREARRRGVEVSSQTRLFSATVSRTRARHHRHQGQRHHDRATARALGNRSCGAGVQRRQYRAAAA